MRLRIMRVGKNTLTDLVKHGCVLLLVLNVLPLSHCDTYLYTLSNQTRHARDIRHSLRSSRLDRSSIYMPDDITPDGDIRAPVLLGVRRDLTITSGPDGFFGVCQRVYRVLHHVRLSPARECQKHRSRQSVLGDISDFYHTVSAPGLN
ncbi:unnamed protein product [Echinostoma caproni]|uniref:Secreted protein n=1 Tax=Echinostoma caproni TaxID=27848 RepID=A0A183BCA8_9TREM|nr:unnamed protein product [Echinostoma caproni]